MKIAFVGKFKNLYDEEYIARSFESLGHTIERVNEKLASGEIIERLDSFNPDLVLWTKLAVGEQQKIRDYCKKYKTACWVFDLYIGYQREARLHTPAFTADYVFTTDGGHQEEFKELGINHNCVRQGIWKDECILYPFTGIENEIIFIGSENPYYPERTSLIKELGAKWYGRFNTNEIRGLSLNELYSKSRIVIGDSVYSPNYWSNRVVETLGRGGFLIHREVEGISEEYPYLVTYKDLDDLKSKIDYYTHNEEERREIVKKNFEWVKNNYTCEKQCQKLLSYIL